MAERPDEGVRAALADLCDAIRSALDLGPYASVTAALAEADFALSTPVPEERLLRGSASAAEGDVPAEVVSLGDHRRRWRSALLYVKGEVDLDNHADIAYWQAEIDAFDRHFAAEAGDGVASALPSPLPSQGEPVAAKPIGFLKPEAGWTEEPRFVYAKHRTAAWMRAVFTVPVFGAEALAAERARADRAEEDVLDRLFEKARECGNYEAMGMLFSQGAMLPAGRAALRARTILKETPDEAR